MRRFLAAFGESASSLGIAIAAICLITIVGINFANVVARYVFNSPFSWAEEAMIFIAIAGVFWGAIAVAWRDVDIRIETFIDLTTGRTRHVLRIITNLISIFVLSWLFLIGRRVTFQVFEFDLRSPALNMPMWIPHAALISGLLLIILTIFARQFAPARPDVKAPGNRG